MTRIEQAIKEAVEKGGWEFVHLEEGGLFVQDGMVKINHINGLIANVCPLSDVLLDPSFWQALGKARGWPTFSPTGYFDNYEDDLEDFSWKVYWHHFIDHLANGKDADSFFEKLV